jgi:hypothetical protein
MFAKYEKSVETTLENIFKQISQVIAKSLLEAKKKANG